MVNVFVVQLEQSFNMVAREGDWYEQEVQFLVFSESFDGLVSLRTEPWLRTNLE